MIHIPDMPLYWRFKEAPGNIPGEPPARTSFSFDHDPKIDLVIERTSAELGALLADIYERNSNVGFNQDGHSLLTGYGEDFWRFLGSLLETYPAQAVLEIGCGGCVLLERLRDQGREVVGVDPSPVAAAAGERKGIRVISEFFPPRSLDTRQELIFEVDVLEHVEQPASFLRSQAQYLAPGGLVVVNVPDCGRSIERGDISMALHQHVNMFDADSLASAFHAAGLEVVRLEKSRYGAGLYCAGRIANSGLVTGRPAGVTRWQRFERLAVQNIDRFRDSVEGARRRGESIGFFMPQRAFPYLATMGWFDGYRVFDNMNVWHGRYLDGLDVPIENQADLVSRPVDHVFVMSLTFGNEVRDVLRRSAPAMKVTTLDEMLAREPA
ncbi:MAG: class I SAM-dependent methyltransferase [Candidatus Parcubacteria bacterium]|nr:class I SAM-dependent methyltransferase [Burkholderiales bacterium]